VEGLGGARMERNTYIAEGMTSWWRVHVEACKRDSVDGAWKSLVVPGVPRAYRPGSLILETPYHHEDDELQSCVCHSITVGFVPWRPSCVSHANVFSTSDSGLYGETSCMVVERGREGLRFRFEMGPNIVGLTPECVMVTHTDFWRYVQATALAVFPGIRDMETAFKEVYGPLSHMVHSTHPEEDGRCGPASGVVDLYGEDDDDDEYVGAPVIGVTIHAHHDIPRDRPRSTFIGAGCPRLGFGRVGCSTPLRVPRVTDGESARGANAGVDAGVHGSAYGGGSCGVHSSGGVAQAGTGSSGGGSAGAGDDAGHEPEM
jgi:hypothetical protein